MAIGLANATFAARQQAIWGEGSIAVASDSTHVGAFDQNIFTQWYSRDGGRGVLIYWHVERGSVVIHSQRLDCTASEVAVMVEGAMHHGTAMQVEGNYVDSHGQSEIGLGITRLLGVRPASQDQEDQRGAAVRPAVGEPDAYPRLARTLTRPIRWSLIAEQYDMMLRYHRHPGRDRRHRGDPAPLHPRGDASDLPGDAGGRPRAEDHLRGPLPARPGSAAGGRRGPQRAGVPLARCPTQATSSDHGEHGETPTLAVVVLHGPVRFQGRSAFSTASAVRRRAGSREYRAVSAAAAISAT
jgi:hypothetical protein